jgi:hypothetical protein
MEMDGSGDVTSNYAMTSAGTNRVATMTLYYANSGAAGAKLDAAKAALQAGATTETCVAKLSEKSFSVGENQKKIDGTRASFAPKQRDNCTQQSLYFFQTAHWVITVKTTASASDADAAKAMDAFVRGLRWDTLDTDSGLIDSAP